MHYYSQIGGKQMLRGSSPLQKNKTAEQIVRIPLTELHPFPDHPYGIREDQAMQDTKLPEKRFRRNRAAAPQVR